MAPTDARRGGARLRLATTTILALACCGEPALAQVRTPAPATSPLGTVITPQPPPAPPDYGGVSPPNPLGDNLGGIPGMIGPRPAPPRRAGARGARTPPERAPLFYVTPRAGVEMTFTDNVFVTNTNRKADLIVSPSAGFLAQGNTPKTRMFIDGSVAYDFYKDTTSFNGARFNGFGDLRTDLFDRFVEVDARAASGQERIDPFGRGPASTRSFGSNQAQLVTYGVTPTARFRTGGFMNAEISYDFSAVNYFNAGASSSNIPLDQYYQNSGRVHLVSGSDFPRLGWEVNGAVERQDRGSLDSDRRYGSGSLTYLLMPQIQLIATAGYDDIREPGFRERVTGAYYTGGFRWAVGPKTRITFEGGWRYHEPYFNGTITYTAMQALQLRASYDQSIDTPQSVTARNLFNIVNTPGGLVLNPITGLPLDPTVSPFGLGGLAFRRKAFEADVSGVLGRNTYSIGGVYERRNVGSLQGEDVRVTAEVARQLALNLRTAISIGYDRVTGSTFAIGRAAETLQARAQIDYALGRRTGVQLAYTHQRINAFPLHTRENVVLLALTRTF